MPMITMTQKIPIAAKLSAEAPVLDFGSFTYATKYQPRPSKNSTPINAMYVGY